MKSHLSAKGADGKKELIPGEGLGREMWGTL
jgi:hypothetical protein